MHLVTPLVTCQTQKRDSICARSRQEKEVWMEAIASALKVMQYDSKPTLPRLVQSRDQLELLKMELKEVQRKRKKLVESTNKASQFQAAILASQEHNLKASKGHRRTLSNSSSVRTNLDRFSFASNVSKAAFGVRPEDPDVLAHEYQKLFLNA
ncbi:hypothetical protein BC830DRAFT_1111231 [Chytriomyces sp. MP71]|nr:hypothetical protein BC830DRAFT_1111231 [Chytriomyces sp. MP71]